MAARREARILQVMSARLITAINGATGNSPAVFSDQLVAKGFISVQGASNIILVTANPPYAIISRLVSNALTRVQRAVSDQKAQRLFDLFLDILRELELEDLAQEMEERYQGEGQEVRDPPREPEPEPLREPPREPEPERDNPISSGELSYATRDDVSSIGSL